MGWGVTRQTVYNLLLWITCQSLEGGDSGDGKLVSGFFCVEAEIELTITSAAAGAYHSMGSRDDEASRRCCDRQSYAWSSIRECISGPDGTKDFRNPLLKTDTRNRLHSSVSIASANTRNITRDSEPKL